jgi:hypothetical protein
MRVALGNSNQHIEVDGLLKVSGDFGKALITLKNTTINVEIYEVDLKKRISLRRFLKLRPNLTKAAALADLFGLTVKVSWKNRIFITLGRGVVASNSNQILTGSPLIKFGNVKKFPFTTEDI